MGAGRGRDPNLPPVAAGRPDSSLWGASVLPPSVRPPACLPGNATLLPRQRPAPLRGIRGARISAPGSQQQGRKPGLSVPGWGPESPPAPKDLPLRLSQLSLPHQTLKAGLCLLSDTQGRMVPLLSDLPRHHGRAVSPPSGISWMPPATENSLTAWLTHLPRAVGSRAPSSVCSYLGLPGGQASPRFCMKLNKSSRNSFLLGSPSSS